MSDLEAYGQAFADFAQSVIDVCADPADAVTGLLHLSHFGIDLTVPGAVVMAARCRRTALAALARVTRTVRLDSYTEARALLDVVRDAFECEITRAGDTADDLSFDALRETLAAVTDDIVRRGASLAPLRRVTLATSLPDAVVAQRLYRDGDRAEEILARARARHPLFLPTSILARSR